MCSLRGCVRNRLSPAACRKCGEEGHYTAECTGQINKPDDKNDDSKSQPSKKSLIFLDTSILREYLEYEQDVPSLLFAFDLEHAIEDQVFLIFFVGNDFLSRLPCLEIREGSIDTLLKIWKAESPRMSGYTINIGNLEYDRIQIILEGLAQRESEIFRSRREGSPTSVLLNVFR